MNKRWKYNSKIYEVINFSKVIVKDKKGIVVVEIIDEDGKVLYVEKNKFYSKFKPIEEVQPLSSKYLNTKTIKTQVLQSRTLHGLKNLIDDFIKDNAIQPEHILQIQIITPAINHGNSIIYESIFIYTKEGN